MNPDEFGSGGAQAPAPIELPDRDSPVIFAANRPSEDAERAIRRELGAVEVFKGSPGAPIGDPDAIFTALGEHGWVLVFPEGEVSRDGAVHRGHPDLGWLVVSARVPVVPVGVRVGRSGERVRVGRPLDYARYWTASELSTDLDGVVLRAITDDVVAHVVELAALDYHDEYGAKEAPRPRTPLLERLRESAIPESERVAQAIHKAERAQRLQGEYQDAQAAEEAAKRQAELASQQDAEGGPRS